MKKKIIFVLLAALAINNLWAELSVGAYVVQEVVYMNETEYSPFGGFGIDCEYDFLDTRVRPVVGMETDFYGLGLELFLKAGGIVDLYANENKEVFAEVNYLIGPNISFDLSVGQGANCLFGYEIKRSEKKAYYFKSGLRYKYFYGYKRYHFVDVLIKMGIKFK